MKEQLWRIIVWVVGRLPVTTQIVLCRAIFSAFSQKEPTKGNTYLLGLYDNLLWYIDQCAIRYENGIHPKHRLIGYHNFFVDHLHENDKVLDIGCGVGSVASSMAKTGARVTAIDINEESIDTAKENFSASGVNFIIGDVTKDLPDAKFDIIVMSNVLEHIENRLELLVTISSKFTPQCFLIRVPMLNRDWIVPFKKELGLPFYCDPEHCVEYSIESFQSEMAAAGLDIESIQIKWGEIWAKVI